MSTGTPEDVSDERLAEMISDWEQNSRASGSHGLDTRYADEHASALRELQRHRARTGYHANCPSCTCVFPNASEEGR
jgi:hypothetical protein